MKLADITFSDSTLQSIDPIHKRFVASLEVLGRVVELKGKRDPMRVHSGRVGVPDRNA